MGDYKQINIDEFFNNIHTELMHIDQVVFLCGGFFASILLQIFMCVLGEIITLDKLFCQFNLVIEQVYRATDFRVLGLKGFKPKCSLF